MSRDLWHANNPMATNLSLEIGSLVIAGLARERTARTYQRLHDPITFCLATVNSEMEAVSVRFPVFGVAIQTLKGNLTRLPKSRH